MKVKLIVGQLMVLTLLTQPAWCAIDDAGTQHPFNFGAGSRAMAMGSAYVAVANDVTSLFWNPAGLAQLDQMEAAAMHIQMFFDTPYDFFGFAYPVLNWGTFAVGAVRVATGDIIVRDERALITSAESGSLDMREYLLSYARVLPFNIHAGVTLKFDQQRLLGDYTSGAGIDAGLFYRLPDSKQAGSFSWENFSCGVMVQNLVGSDLKLKKAIDTLPVNIKAGLAYHQVLPSSIQQQLLFSFMWEKSTRSDAHFAFGGEYQLLELLAIRGGFNTTQSWTAGGGIHYSGIMLDYALAGEEIGLSHRFTLSYRFGPSLSEQKRLIEKKRQAELDDEAKKRAELAVAEAKKTMDKQLASLEKRHKKEKRAMLSKRRTLLAKEKQRTARAKKEAAADEYFKALHYFQGIKDYLQKNYKAALLEFETVEKYDPKYMELQVYLDKTRQRMKGDILLSETSMKSYYQGIDLYVEERFEEAIGVWEKILEKEPNNVLVIRNIEEAKERLARLKAMEENFKQDEVKP